MTQIALRLDPETIRTADRLATQLRAAAEGQPYQANLTRSAILRAALAHGLATMKKQHADLPPPRTTRPHRRCGSMTPR